MIEWKNVGDTKDQLLRCFPFFSKTEAGDIISTGLYISYQTIIIQQFKRLLRNSFRCHHSKLRDTRWKKVPWFLLGIGMICFVLMIRKASKRSFSTKRRFLIIDSKQAEITMYRGFGRQRRRGFGSLAQVIGRTTTPFLRKSIVLAAKRVGAYLLYFTAPEKAEVFNGRKNFKTEGQGVWEGKLSDNSCVSVAGSKKEQQAEKRLRTGGRQAE